jgi:hypothetical protein
MPFVKVDSQLLESSLWPLRPARDLFLTMLMMAKPIDITEPMTTYKVGSNEEDEFVIPPGENYGLVEAAGSGIARRAVVTDEEWEAALAELAGPDPESRNPRFDGRRIARVSGGFVVLNYGEYREKDYSTPRVQKFRERQREANGGTEGNAVSERSETPETQAEAYTTTTTKGKSKKKVEKGNEDQEWIESLKADPTYQNLNIDVAIGKAVAWAKVNDRVPTKRFLINWLNREKPVKVDRATSAKAASQAELDKLEVELGKTHGIHCGVFQDAVKNLRSRNQRVTIAGLRAQFTDDESTDEVI